MKKNNLLLLVPMILSVLASCDSKTTVSIHYEGNDASVQFAIDEVKQSLIRNNITYTEKGGEYTVDFKDYDTTLESEAYSIDVDNKVISIKGGDATGLMYGGLQLAETINVNDGIANVSNYSESPYLQFRGVSIRPPMDLRTPSYTENGDSTRWNLENTWDLDYWKGLFDLMAKMRYNLLSFATVNSLPNMVKVPGYEDCAIDDVWKYNGTYDDTYLGNCTNMYRPEHIEEGNYTVIKKMTIDEKIEFWKQVMSMAHDRGIHWQYSTMNIYTFYESTTSYGITDSRDNETTKDYFVKAYQTLLETYPYIDQIKTTCGENMDYPAAESKITDQWYRDVYGKAVENVLDKDAERAKTFQLGFAGVGNTLLDDGFYGCFEDYKYNLYVNKRYNDTRLLSVPNCTDNDEYIESMPDGWNMIYNVRGEDAYHLTWGDPDFAREFCRNSKKNHVLGWHFAIDGYYVSGKEYEFKDDALNGDYYYNRHWIMYSMFGRFAYNPEVTDAQWKAIVEDHYEDVDKDLVDKAWEAMNTAGKIMPNIICQYAPGGTDAAFLPEMCASNPTLFGFLDIKRFINNGTADPDGDIYSFAEYAKLLQNNQTNLTKRTPFDVANKLRELATSVLTTFDEIYSKIDNVQLRNCLLDQKSFALLANYYADKFEGAMNLRIYNDFGDKSYQDKAVANLTDGLEVWKSYADLYSSRFVVERLPRHGVIDPNAFTKVVEKDITTASTWTRRAY